MQAGRSQHFNQRSHLIRQIILAIVWIHLGNRGGVIPRADAKGQNETEDMLRKPWMGVRQSEEVKDGASFLIAANVNTRMVGDIDEELSLLRQSLTAQPVVPDWLCSNPCHLLAFTSLSSSTNGSSNSTSLTGHWKD